MKRAKKPAPRKRQERFRLIVDYVGAPTDGSEAWSAYRERQWIGERVTNALDATRILRIEVKALKLR